MPFSDYHLPKWREFWRVDLEGSEAEGRGCCRCPGEGHTGEQRQKWCLFIGQVLSWTEQEGRLGSTQPRAREPCPGEQAPAQAFLQSHCHSVTGPKMGKVKQEDADKAEGSAGEGVGT